MLCGDDEGKTLSDMFNSIAKLLEKCFSKRAKQIEYKRWERGREVSHRWSLVFFHSFTYCNWVVPPWHFSIAILHTYHKMGKKLAKSFLPKHTFPFFLLSNNHNNVKVIQPLRTQIAYFKTKAQARQRAFILRGSTITGPSEALILLRQDGSNELKHETEV